MTGGGPALAVPDAPARAAAESAIQRLVLVAVPLWLLSSATVALAPGSGWSIPLVAACVATTAVAYGLFVWLRVAAVLLVPLVGAGVVLALSSPPSPDLAGGSVVSTWASLTSLCLGALVRGRWGVVSAAAGGIGLLGVARVRQDSLGTVGEPTRWLEIAAFAVFAGLLAAVVADVLRRTAAQADDVATLRARAVAAAAREQAGQAELRRVGRLLHDTVINTLCAIHRWTTAGRDVAVARCAADLDLLRSVESGGSSEPQRLVDAARARAQVLGLDLDVRVETLGPTLDPRTALAIEGALREALNNVSRHSGVARATLTWSWDGAAGRVAVADRGRGFLTSGGWTGGAAESVAARCAEAGVQSTVASQPGAGTTVTLAWRPLGPGSTADDAKLGVQAGSAIRGELDALMAATVLRSSAVVAAIGVLATLLMPADLPRWASLAALAIIGVVAWLASSVRRGIPLPRIPVLVYPLTIAAATVLPALGRADSPAGGLWWWGPPAGLGVSFGAFLLDRRRVVVPWVVVGVVVGIVLGASQIGPGTLSNRPDQVSLLIVSLGAIAAMVAYRRRLTEAWVAGRRDQERMQVELAGAARAAEEIRIRSQLLTVARRVAEPVLAGVAEGTLDPLDPEVRAWCGKAESTLRALSAVPITREGGMGTVLADAVVAAPGRGVELAVRLGPDAVPPPEEALAEVERVLTTVLDQCPEGGSAQVTFLRMGTNARMVLLADLADEQVVGRVRTAASGGRLGPWSVSQVGEQVLCEASWTTD